MTFNLPRGSLVTDVSIVQRFSKDGKHSRQTLLGRVVSGAGTDRDAVGTISGGGTDVEVRPRQIAASDLVYRIDPH